ncbi:hypothetical protein [Chromobacterium vaccinii]|uniref:hypothetical protein n=1 Tax=Chromobacterium vaccinii TaxID=1108595 RepID=UPI0011C019DD|nr:hypothetical protein [Chromobacterium vaccinii]
MNKLSAKILQMIQDAPSLMRLSAVADYYQPGKPGCGGMDSIPSREKGTLVKYTANHVCPVNRNHEMAQGKDQKKENITYKKTLLAYELKPGH